MDNFIRIKGAKEHNLKNIDIDIPQNQLVVITGLSGSGKSSLAFDTLYAEGQRRYVESLSSYARQFLNINNKPDVEYITGLSPAIAIDQKTTSKNPRSTVGTTTEIYDYMRLLFARAGVPYSPATGEPIQKQTVSQIVDLILTLKEDTRFYILSPIVRGAKGEYKKELYSLSKKGFQRVKIDGIIYDMDDLPVLDRNKKHTIEVVVDRLVAGADLGNRLADSVGTALHLSNGLMRLEIAADGEKEAEYDESLEHCPNIPVANLKPGEGRLFSEKFSCPVSNFQISEIEPRLFSFNSPFGACKTCEGLGIEHYFEPSLVVPNENLSILSGALAPFKEMLPRNLQQLLKTVATEYAFNLHLPFKALPEDIKQIILYGSGNQEVDVQTHDGMRGHTIKQLFEGIIPMLDKLYKDKINNPYRDSLSEFVAHRSCSQCSGYRLNSEALCIKLDNIHVGQLADMTISKAYNWCQNLPNTLTDNQKIIAKQILKEITNRLAFLNNVGLDYLTLSRPSGTLSGGESQRIRLASQVGSGLCGVLYVLDEPSIGLHQCDNDRLIKMLHNLRDLGNTVVVVEHDEETMGAADYIIDMGPGAGIHGGEIIAKGTIDEISENPNSITGQYLTGKRKIHVPKNRRKTSGRALEITGVTTHNLRNIDVSIPLGLFTCVTGVSGGGKSSLIIQTLYRAAIHLLEGRNVTPGPYKSIKGLEYIDKIIDIDQSPIGRTPRSNPATYTGAFTPIRDWYVNLPEAKARGYKVGHFSFNVKGGRCEICQGDGLIKIEMHFLPDVYVTCDECRGKRYNREILEVQYKGKSISDVLDMTAEKGLEFFNSMPNIKDKLEALNEVGLGYIHLGQSATTLSGGEAQRVKLAKELSKRATGKTLYILDEPTTGLHSADIEHLLKVLHSLVDRGNTVIVIEHNMDVIKTADHIVDIGPGGGDKGGYLVASGTPEEVAKVKESVTGQYLKKYL